ncbi:MAG: SDR family oxidoreductase [Kofleriaceae bacterium]|nr:SDR family oxidoreductase [Kofleriaceae bacterium]MCL4223920.1 SDR family oxidoreductase [Myxococcales bacterium]
MTASAPAPADLGGRTFVVTGANTGIGKETARDLAARGAHVVLACRSEAKTRPVMDELAAASPGARLDFVALDLGDLDSVRACAAALLARDQPIHVLVNNAGLAGVRGQTKDGFELAFGTNHLGHYLLTRLLLERVRGSAAPGVPARIVNVSSDSHYSAPGIDWDAVRQPSRTTTGLREYEVSKLANVLFTRELARRLPPAEVTTYALHPGVVASDIWQRRVPRFVSFIPRLFMKNTRDGAATTLHCATSPEVATHTGRYYADRKEKRPSRVAGDDALAAELWDRSAAWVGLEP